MVEGEITNCLFFVYFVGSPTVHEYSTEGLTIVEYAAYFDHEDQEQQRYTREYCYLFRDSSFYENALRFDL